MKDLTASLIIHLESCEEQRKNRKETYLKPLLLPEELDIILKVLKGDSNYESN